jgi:hypothetical protein
MEKIEHDKRDIESKINSLNNSQKENLLKWAIEVKKIQDNKSLSKKDKIYDLKKLNNKQAFKDVITFVVNYSKSYWKKASWSQKIGIIGLTSGLIVAGSSGGAGIAALGGAIGLPLFLVTAAGGTLIGTLIDSLKKKSEK